MEIRYAVAVTATNETTGITGSTYVAREGAMVSPGQVSAYVEDAKTWATKKGAEKWVSDRPDWVAYRTKHGAKVEVVQVEMGRRYKSVPIRRA